MKNIAVLCYDFTIEYHISVVEGIRQFFEGKDDVSIFFFPLNVPHATTYDFDYQYWTTSQLLQSKSIDGAIVVTNSFTGYFSIERLTEELKKILHIPVVSVATPIDIKNSSYSCISSQKVYSQVVKHLKEKHGCKRFAFYNAKVNASPESQERQESFIQALKENKLTFDEKLIFDGDFTPSLPHRFLSETYKNKDELDFDALLCANDYMAMGAILGLQEAGFNIPDDVCVFGFDNSEVATTVTATISTIEQHISESGKKSAELIYKMVHGKRVPKKEVCECVPIYRKSCGCVPIDGKVAGYYDQFGNYSEAPFSSDNILDLFGNPLNDMSSILHMQSLTDTVKDLNDFFFPLVKTLQRLYIHRFAICIYEKEFELAPEDDFVLPEKAELLIYYDEELHVERNYYDQGGIEFNPYESIVPKEFLDKYDKKMYYVVPIFLKNINYGYMICDLPMRKYTLYEVYVRLLSTAFVHSFTSSKKLARDEIIAEQARSVTLQNKTDELTKVLNRRGFFNYAQRLIDLSNVTGTRGSLFFIDLDGLKKINDSYGHEVGDVAIKTAAEVLQDAFHKADLIGRLGGDEFAALAPGFAKENVEYLRERIDVLSKEYSEKNNLPVVVSFSIGVVEYDSTKFEIEKLLVEADHELYLEKRVKHKK